MDQAVESERVRCADMVARLFSRVGFSIAPGQRIRRVVFEHEHVGDVRQNEYGFWVSNTFKGKPRYYESALAAAVDLCMAWIYPVHKTLFEPLVARKPVKKKPKDPGAYKLITKPRER